LYHRIDSVDDAFEFVTRHLTEYALAERGGGVVETEGAQEVIRETTTATLFSFNS
jgi:hypothetical protein